MSKASLFNRIAKANADASNRVNRRFRAAYDNSASGIPSLKQQRLMEAEDMQNKLQEALYNEYKAANEHEKILHPAAVDDIRENYLKAMGYIAPDDNSIKNIDDLDRWSLENWNEPYPTQEMQVPDWGEIHDLYIGDPKLQAPKYRQ